MDIQKKIIVNSLELFKVYGIKQVSMTEIADSLGMSKKTLYVHFTGKKDLVNQAIKFLFDTHFYTIERILAEKIATVEKIRKIYEYGINYLIQIAPIFLSDLKKHHSATYSDYDFYRRKIIFGIVKKLLEEGQLQGEIDQTINTELFCEFHLLNLDKNIISTPLLYECSMDDLLNNTIGVSLKGILKYT